MGRCEVQKWKVKELADAIRNLHRDDKKIVVPLFQRGKRWSKKQQNGFIDSLKNGFPVGTMLFFKKILRGRETYILVDGLQRGTSIKKYMENPTEFFNVGNISDALCRSLLDVVSSDDEANYTAVRSILEEFIKKNKTFSGLQYIEPANGIVKKFGPAYADGQEVVGLLTKLSDIMAVFFDERIRLHEAIADTEIPVIVYQEKRRTFLKSLKG